jgi:hypothetical protein
VGSPKGLRKALALSDKLYWHAAFASLARLGLSPPPPSPY